MLVNNPVIVTGATGFVGQHLVPLLVENGHYVTAIARNQEKAKSFDWYGDVNFISLDLSEGIKNLEISPKTSLIHLAWSGLNDYKSTSHFEADLPNSYNFIKSCVQKGVKQVLVTGTCFEYGLQSGNISSNALPSPITPYGFAKDALRNQLKFLALNYPFRLQWARLFYMFGQGQNKKSLISQLEAAINNGDAIFNMSGGEQLRDYLPVEDVARQLYSLYVDQKHGSFNICSGKPISVRRLVERHLQKKSSDIILNLGYYPYPDHEPFAFWGERDIADTLYLPALPNSPLTAPSTTHLAPIRLRHNIDLDFVENDAFDPNLINYDADYDNNQAFSSRFQLHMRSVLDILKSVSEPDSSLVEVGCGKGDFVELVQDDGYFKVKGYDATYEGTSSSIERRYLTKNDSIKADLVVLRHVLEHIQSPHNFLNMLKDIFGNTKVYIEVPNYSWITKNKTFFDITFEHVNYFTQKSLRNLFGEEEVQQGLIFDDQYQYIIADLSNINTEFENLYNLGKWEFLSFRDIFPNFENKIENLEQSACQRPIYVWGAGTKGCLFLAHCKNMGRLIKSVKGVVDQNPTKNGKFLPGSSVPIQSENEFLKSMPDDAFIIVANPAYKREIELKITQAGYSNFCIETL